MFTACMVITFQILISKWREGEVVPIFLPQTLQAEIKNVFGQIFASLLFISPTRFPFLSAPTMLPSSNHWCSCGPSQFHLLKFSVCLANASDVRTVLHQFVAYHPTNRKGQHTLSLKVRSPGTLSHKTSKPKGSQAPQKRSSFRARCFLPSNQRLILTTRPHGTRFLPAFSHHNLRWCVHGLGRYSHTLLWNFDKLNSIKYMTDTVQRPHPQKCNPPPQTLTCQREKGPKGRRMGPKGGAPKTPVLLPSGHGADKRGGGGAIRDEGNAGTRQGVNIVQQTGLCEGALECGGAGAIERNSIGLLASFLFERLLCFVWVILKVFYACIGSIVKYVKILTIVQQHLYSQPSRLPFRPPSQGEVETSFRGGGLTPNGGVQKGPRGGGVGRGREGLKG